MRSPGRYRGRRLITESVLQLGAAQTRMCAESKHVVEAGVPEDDEPARFMKS